MPTVNPKGLNYEGIILTTADFNAGRDDGAVYSPGDRPSEVATCEVGEDGQLAAYDAVRIGDSPDPQDPTRGKLYHSWADDAGADLPDDTQVRFAFRDKNSNRRDPATPWISLRDLDRDRPDHRKVLRPRQKNGVPWFVKSGRLILVEMKHESQDITPSLANSTMETPARGGY